MRFKTSAKKIMCIRTTYLPGSDGKAGRGQDKTVISIDLWSKTVPDEAKVLLDESEQKQLQAFLTERQQHSDQVIGEYTLQKLGKTLQVAVKALESPETLDRALSDEEVTAIWAGLDSMRTMMRRAGYQRPKGDGKAEGEGAE